MGIAFLLLILGIILAFFKGIIGLIGWLFIFISCISLFFHYCVKKYDEFERGIIFRMGRFNRIAGPGWAIVIPFFEKEYARVDVRIKMLHIFLPNAFTKDDLRLKVDSIVYYRVVDPKKATLTISDYVGGLNNLIMSEMRNAIASLTMREVFGRIGKLNDLVKDRIRGALLRWGLDVPMVQIRGIMPPDEVIEAMQRKEVAANMLQARRFLAEARRIAIEAIGEAAKKLDDMAIMYLYIRALQEMAKGSATKLIFPMQFFDILKGMEGSVSKALAGIGVAQAVQAMKNVLSKT